jgi:hypothetical protein
MWICSQCGEPNEPNFELCWNCASKEMEEQVTAAPPRPMLPNPAAEPRLRSGGSIIVRILIAFVVGTVLGGAAFHTFMRSTDPLTSATYALLSGIALAIFVGIFFWVIFPYERESARQPGPSEEAEV